MSEEHISGPKPKEPASWLSTVVAVGTLILTALSLIPAFASLKKDEPRVQYAVLTKVIEAPDLIDKALFSKFLLDNGIPSETTRIQLKNTGTASSKSIKIAVTTPGEIVRYNFTPDAKTRPIWVEIEDSKELGMNSGVTEVKTEVKNLAPGKLLVFGVGFQGNTQTGLNVEVYADGVAAAQLPDISEAKMDNKFTAFELPLAILGIGLGLTTLAVLVQLLLRNKKYRQLFADALMGILKGLLQSVLPFR